MHTDDPPYGPLLRLRHLRQTLATLTVAALMALSLAGPVHAATLTETEPDGTIATADSLPLGGTMVGSTHSTLWYEYDFYGVYLPQAGLTRIDFRFPAGLTSATVYGLTVYDPGGGRSTAMTSSPQTTTAPDCRPWTCTCPLAGSTSGSAARTRGIPGARTTP